MNICLKFFHYFQLAQIFKCSYYMMYLLYDGNYVIFVGYCTVIHMYHVYLFSIYLYSCIMIAELIKMYYWILYCLHCICNNILLDLHYGYFDMNMYYFDNEMNIINYEMLLHLYIFLIRVIIIIVVYILICIVVATILYTLLDLNYDMLIHITIILNMY